MPSHSQAGGPPAAIRHERPQGGDVVVNVSCGSGEVERNEILNRLEDLEDTIMGKLEDLQALQASQNEKLDGVTSEVVNVATEVASLNQKLQNLPPGDIPQSVLDQAAQVNDRLAAVVAALKAIPTPDDAPPA